MQRESTELFPDMGRGLQGAREDEGPEVKGISGVLETVLWFRSLLLNVPIPLMGPLGFSSRSLIYSWTQALLGLT